MTKPCH